MTSTKKSHEQQSLTLSAAFLFVCMGIMCFIYLICGIRTNIVFEIIFLFLMLGFVLLAGAYWQLAELNASLATKLQVVSFRFKPPTFMGKHLIMNFLSLVAGWWSYPLRRLHGGLVSIFCADAGQC